MLLTHLHLLVVRVVLLLAVETGHALGHARDRDLARRLDPLLVKFRGCHFSLDISSVSKVMLVHIICIFI